MKNYLRKYWPSLSIVIIFAMAAIVFLCINQDTLGLICLINAVTISCNAGLELRDDKAKEQNQLIEALQRKIAALEGLVREIEEREQLDYEHLKRREDSIADTIKKLKQKGKVNDEQTD